MTLPAIIGLGVDIALGAAAFKLAFSVDKSQKVMAALLQELTKRVEALERKIGG